MTTKQETLTRIPLAFASLGLTLALASCATNGAADASCQGKCDGEQPLPSCTAQRAGALDVYPAGTHYVYLPDRFVVTEVSIATPIASDLFPADPFNASPFYNTCPVTIGLRPDAAADAVAAAKAALGDAQLSVAQTSAAHEPVILTFATVTGLPPIDASAATFGSTSDGGFEITVSVPTVDCSALATLLVHQAAIASAASQRTMACDGGTVPLTISGIGSYEATAVEADNRIYAVIDAIWNAEQALPLLDVQAQMVGDEASCSAVASVLGPIEPQYVASMRSTLDAVIPYGGTSVTLDNVHAAGLAAQTATVAFMQQVMQGCGASSTDEATVRTYLSRTDLGPSGYTGADNLIAQTYQEGAALAAYDPASAHQSWPFEH